MCPDYGSLHPPSPPPSTAPQLSSATDHGAQAARTAYPLARPSPVQNNGREIGSPALVPYVATVR
jgi:hypothetical protein